ncbi:hypothetical protein [Abyssisolibacter fermentans]|nr:hypothetical protein [Abyssisolibacter fermentans]
MYNKEGEEILIKSVEYIYDANGNEIRQKAKELFNEKQNQKLIILSYSM